MTEERKLTDNERAMLKKIAKGFQPMTPLTHVDLDRYPNDPFGLEIPVYQHHFDTVRAELPDASEERIEELAKKLALTEWREGEDV